MTGRRRCTRWVINRELKMKVEGDQDYAVCHVRDISFTGCNLSTQLRLPIDEFLKLTIVLSDVSAITIEAWVAWQKSVDASNNYGIYFNKIKDGDKEAIYKYIRHNFPRLLNNQWWKDIKREGGEIMEEEKFQDRRIFDRFTAKFPVKFINLRENKESEASIDDVSAKGIGITSNEQLSPRTALEMWLEIPDKGEPLYTRGEVVWSRRVEPDKFKVGVNLEKADLMGLSRVLRSI
jgi:hypothetical protein